MTNWEAFRAFLEQRGARIAQYRPRTVDALLMAAKRFERLLGEGVPTASWPTHPMARQAAERLQAWGQAAPELDAAARQYLRDFRPPARARKRVARSMDEAALDRFSALVERSTEPEARVLEVMLATGMRVADVLSITRANLLNSMRTGHVAVTVKGDKERHKPVAGAPEAWGKLADGVRAKTGAVNVAAFVCDGNPSPDAGQCAYQRVRRALVRYAKAAEVSGRIHLHRIRRTVGVQAIRSGADLTLVAQLLDHNSINTTAGYLDEAREEEVAALQQKLGRRKP